MNPDAVFDFDEDHPSLARVDVPGPALGRAAAAAAGSDIIGARTRLGDHATEFNHPFSYTDLTQHSILQCRTRSAGIEEDLRSFAC